MVRRRVGHISMLCAIAAGSGAVVGMQDDGAPVAAQDLAPAAVESGLIQFDTSGPTRILDTRTDTFRPGPWVPNLLEAYAVFTPGVPANATAVMVNITIVADQAGSVGYAAAKGATLNRTSTVNWTGPGVFANFALAPVTRMPDPLFLLRLEGNHPVHVVVDLEGWVVPAA